MSFKLVSFFTFVTMQKRKRGSVSMDHV